MDSNSTPQSATEAHKAYQKFFDDAVGDLPKIDPFGDLDNDVHPIFSRENFRQHVAESGNTESLGPISDAVYSAILPALRLTSLLITERSMCPVFDHIANGVVTKDKVDGEFYIAESPLEGTDLGYSYVQEVFKYMAANISIEFPSVEPKFDRTSIAMTLRYQQRPTILKSVWLKGHTGQQIERKLCSCQNVIKFRPFFLEYFEKDMRHDTTRGQLNALFVFVRALMHEITHAFGNVVENAASTPGRVIEHRWSIRIPLREYGYAYDTWFFRGRPMREVAQSQKLKQSATIFPSGILLLSGHILLLDKPDTIFAAKESKPDYFLRANDIRKWFLKSTWTAICGGQDMHAEIMNTVETCQLRLSDTADFMHAHAESKVIASLKWTPHSDPIKGWFDNYAKPEDLKGLEKHFWRLWFFPFKPKRASNTT